MRALILLLALLPAVALAQEVGQATVDGRAVVLFENGSWRFADAPVVGAACEGSVRVASAVVPVSFCLSEAEWRRDFAAGAFEQVFAHRQAELSLGLITERSSFDPDVFRNAIVQNAQYAAGLKPVEVLEDRVDTIEGTRWRRLKMAATVDGIDVVYWNYSRSTDGGSAQVVFWTARQQEADAQTAVDRVTPSLRMGD